MPEEPVVIKVRDDGPLKVSGPAVLRDADGGTFALPEGPFVLCRCGHSASKPFCDGSHREQGFRDAGRAA